MRRSGSKNFLGDVQRGGVELAEIMPTPITINMLTTAPSAVGQGTWVKVVNVDHLYNGLFYNSSNTDADNFSVAFSCPAGKYLLCANLSAASGRAKLDVFVDATKIVSAHDLYSASANHLNVLEVAAVQIAAGAHTLKFAANGKNGSSTAYIIFVGGISLTRTGA